MAEGQAVTQPEVIEGMVQGVTVRELESQAALRISEDILKSEGQLAPEETTKEALKVEAETKPEGEVKVEAESEPQKSSEGETLTEVRKHKLTVKSEGGVDEEMEVDDEELKRGFMRYKDYQRKTTELARERDGVRDKVKSEIEPKLQEYETKLKQYETAVWKALAPEIERTDWNDLAAKDPAEWARRMQTVNNVNAVLVGVRDEMVKVAQERQVQAKETLSKQIRESVETLKSEISGWNDELYTKILKTGQDYGWKPEEVNAITDPRAIKVLHDAMKWRALQAKPVADKKVVSVPKVVKPGAAHEKPDQIVEKWSKGMAKLKQTGKTDDALALAHVLLEREGIT